MGIGGTNGRKTSNNGLTYDNRRMDKYAGKGEFNGTSAFSPTLCEVIYKWFGVKNAVVFDPFSGGITRGIMAAICGYTYTGFDINPDQVTSNYQEYQKLQHKFDISGKSDWVCADTDTLICPEFRYDLIFTCPPYYNLERYTKDPNDLSNATTYCDF